MERLGKAVAAGYAKVEQMRQDDDLAALRDRLDFQKILAGLDNEAIIAAREAVRAEPENAERRDRLKALLRGRAWALATLIPQ